MIACSSLHHHVALISSLLLIISYCTAFVPHPPSFKTPWLLPQSSSSFFSLRSRLYDAVTTSSRKRNPSSSQQVVMLANATHSTVVYYKDDDDDDTTNQEYLEPTNLELSTLEKLLETTTSTTTTTATTIPTTTTTTTTTPTTTSLEQPKKKKKEGFNGLSSLNNVWNARLLLLGAAALYGTNFSLIKLLGNDLPVGISATLRFGLASLATLPWLSQPSKNGLPLSTTTTFKSSNNIWETMQQLASTSTIGATLAGLEVGLWNSVGYLAQAVGLQTTDASKSAFICSLAVVVVPMMDFLSGKRLLPRQVIGAILAVAGVGVLELGGDLSLSSGDVASLLQPIMFGIAFWRMETAMRKYPEEANRTTAAQLLAVFLTSAIYGWTTCNTVDFSQIQSLLWNPMILGSLFFTGIITTALTIYMETIALKTLTAAETTLILSTEPLWGAAFASLLIGEAFGMDAAMGATLIIAGCIFSNLGVNGVLEMIGRKKQDEVIIEETIVEEEQESLNVQVAERALLEVGLIGLVARLIALLEADILIGGAASIAAAEEIVEEVSTKL